MSVTYFDRPGEENTERTLELALRRAKELGIRDVVVASTTGRTAEVAVKYFNPREFNLVIVTHMYGFIYPGKVEFPDELRRRLESLGVKVLTCTHSLSGVERAIRKTLRTVGPVEIIANALRLFGEGTKVAVEIVVMAADAGLIPVNKEVIAVAGTVRGADTALVIKPANSTNFFDLEVREVICKPRRRK